MNGLDLFSEGKESGAHRKAKERVYSLLLGKPDKLLIDYEGPQRYATLALDVRNCQPVLECAYPQGLQVKDFELFKQDNGWPSFIFDIGLVVDGMVVGGIEVMKSHWLDSRKKEKIKRANLFCIGITARMHEWPNDENHYEAKDLIFSPGSRTRFSMHRGGP